MKITAMTHDISAGDYAQEIALIETLLHTHGYDTTGMDFSGLIAKKLGDAFADQVRASGITIKNHHWEKRQDESLRIKVYCFEPT